MKYTLSYHKIAIASLFFLTFLIMNLVFLIRYREQILETDARFYYITGRNIAHGKGYSLDGYTPTIDYPPGYPLFIAVVMRLFGSSILTIQIAQIALSLFTLLMLYKLTSFYTHEFCLSLIPCLLYILNYKFIQFNCLILSESFSLFLLVFSLFSLRLFMGKSRILFVVIFSLAFALLIITRAEFQYFVIILLLYTVYLSHKSKKPKIALKFLCFIPIMGSIILPVIIRNNKYFGAYKIAFHGGMSLFQGTYIPYDGLWHDWGGRTVSINNGEIPDEIFAKIQSKDLKTTDEILFSEGIKNIINNGFHGIPVYLKNISRLLFAFPLHDENLTEVAIQRKYYIFLNFTAILLFAMGIPVLIKNRLFADSTILFIFILLLYTIFSHMFVAVDPRFGFMSLILIYFYAPFGLKLFGRINKKTVC